MSNSAVKESKGQAQPIILKEDEKIPLFLIKLWNIVEDPAYYDVIRWDTSGYSFHILDPYSFCRNVLPQYFKHNNLNSLIRQLNMYGFRKMISIDRTSLARAESDQDHLEFSHPCFVREHPDLLVNIKRKAPTTRPTTNDGTVNVSSKDFSGVFDELRRLRERQSDMETKMTDITKENEMVWQEMGHLRGAHVKQQQIVTKLVQFMVALLQQPSKRLGKRNIMAIDEFEPKRQRTDGDIDISLPQIQNHNVGEVLDRLMRKYGVNANRNNQTQVTNRRTNNAPIISDVTDELDILSSNQYPQQSQFFEQYPQQSSQYSGFNNQMNRAPNMQASNMPINSNMQSQSNSAPINMNKRPQTSVRQQLALGSTLQQSLQNPIGMQQSGQHPIVMQQPLQQSVQQPQIMQQGSSSSYQMPDNVRDPIPIVSSPPENIPLAATSTDDPIITSPIVGGGPINFSPTEFATYLDGVNSSIDECRNLIGGHWDDLDLDGLLNGYEDDNNSNTPAISPQNQQVSHIQQTSTARSNNNFVQPNTHNLPYSHE